MSHEMVVITVTDEREGTTKKTTRSADIRAVDVSNPDIYKAEALIDNEWVSVTKPIRYAKSPYQAWQREIVLED